MANVALVTGANRGIGLAIAERLLEEGYAVAAAYRSNPPDNQDLFPVKCDVTSQAQIDQAFDEIERDLGTVEVLIANAGITKDNLLPRMSEDDFTDVLNSNLTSGYRLTKRAIKPMMKQRKGRIIFISSVVGTTGQAGQANYAASKAGLVGLARSIAKEFASRNITANVIAPGPVKTDMIDELTEQQRENILAAVPLGRFAEPEEVAAMAAFLASDQAGFITGAIIPVDGGIGMS
ncbi:MAG: beta-ketoacyl-ACP reductase [Acidimicrobiaceae bacterium]|jgi:3-oxoacyl-[acyl-carrier protein] reductase|nr:beta-ketoacyl-ACP reductase [Acidimicrobiaceae bacterium]|tara:strand:- start:638 stop:1342 length:705 start_codon:yes stop_codon:yes gene_type:complete